MSNTEDTPNPADPESDAEEQQAAPSTIPSGAKFEFVFGAGLALIPLGLWTSISIWMMYLVLIPGDCVIGIDEDNDAINECKINSIALSVYNVSFGLVSALVIAELAVTPTGKDPSDRLVEGAADVFRESNRCLRGIIPWVPALYMIVWVIVGLSSLIIGGFVVGGAAGTLKDTGMTWFGTVITAVYTYFGLNRPMGETDISGTLTAATPAGAADTNEIPTVTSAPARSSPVRAITIGAGGGSGRLSAL